MCRYSEKKSNAEMCCSGWCHCPRNHIRVSKVQLTVFCERDPSSLPSASALWRLAARPQHSVIGSSGPPGPIPLAKSVFVPFKFPRAWIPSIKWVECGCLKRHLCELSQIMEEWPMNNSIYSQGCIFLGKMLDFQRRNPQEVEERNHQVKNCQIKREKLKIRLRESRHPRHRERGKVCVD